MRHTKDNRGESFWDIVEELPGQINVSITKPGESRGFHLHQHKKDYWFVATGVIQVVTSNDLEHWQSQILMNGDYIEIEPENWHAYKNVGGFPAILVYYETEKSGIAREDDYEKPLTVYDGWRR